MDGNNRYIAPLASEMYSDLKKSDERKKRIILILAGMVMLLGVRLAVKR